MCHLLKNAPSMQGTSQWRCIQGEVQDGRQWPQPGPHRLPAREGLQVLSTQSVYLMLGPSREAWRCLVRLRDGTPCATLRQKPFMRRLLRSQGTAPFPVVERGQLHKERRCRKRCTVLALLSKEAVIDSKRVHFHSIGKLQGRAGHARGSVPQMR